MGTQALTRAVWPRAVVDARYIWWLDRYRLVTATASALVIASVAGPWVSPLVVVVGMLLISYAWREARVQRLRLFTSVGSHVLVETADARLVQELAAAINQDPTLPGAVVCRCGRVAWPGEPTCPRDGEPLRGPWHADL